MIKLVFTLFLFLLAHCASYFRLDTKQTTKLNVGDQLISTLGTFKAALKKQGCMLSISMFNPDKLNYTSKGDFIPNSFNKNCDYLEIVDGKVRTNTGDAYIEVRSEAYNQSTIFNIDDQGVMRLITTYNSANRVDVISAQVVFDSFKIQPKYIRSFSNLYVDFGDRFTARSNQRNWKFIAEFGQLTIYYAGNPGIQRNYVYSSITIRDSRIYDFSNKTFPGVLYNNLTFHPRCFEPRKYLGFKPPYTFQIDPYWPIVKLYEQGGYKIFEIAYGNLPQYDFQTDFTQINYYHFYSPCPRKTFQYRGDCVSKCPSPYYHEIRGQAGFCVLTCEQYAVVDQQKRICSCVTGYQAPKLDSKTILKCPRDAQQTPYGCVCKKGFYDSILTFSCVTKCPSATFAKNGLCMRCPQNCATCQQDAFHRSFLECKSCKSGYKLVDESRCQKNCITNHGYSLVNQICKKCEDINCVDCSNDPKICLKCNILTSLDNGKCKDSCALPARQIYSEYFDTKCISPSTNLETQCFQFLSSHYDSTPFLKCDSCFIGVMHLDTCVNSCPTGYYAHNNKYCACSGVKNMTINDQCLSIPACPITMSFDIRSHSCLSCPFGCMSCINTQCTSCNPGYFLYISPQSILCRRKSPLFPCDNQYSWQRNNVCLVTEYNDMKLFMTLCREKIPQCQVCIPQSSQICILCNQKFYIYNNTCIPSCPDKMIPYQNTCILLQIDKCVLPHLLSVSKSAIVTIDKIEASQPYNHYIYGGKQAANDPVGYIPYFQKLTVLSTDGIPRETFFFEPKWYCLKCVDGMGLSPDHSKCLPCVSPCKNCYYAQNNSCIDLGNNTDNNNTNNNTNTTGCPYYTDSTTSKCLQSCSSGKYPQVKNGILTCSDQVSSDTKNYLKIDSAIYSERDGSQIAIFAFSQKLQKLGIQGQLGIPLEVKLENQTIQSSSGQTKPKTNYVGADLQDGEYLIINETAEAYILNFTSVLKKIQGASSKSSFPNKVYGINGQKSPQMSVSAGPLSQVQPSNIFNYAIYSNFSIFVQSWLAYIGYILSIVIILLHAVFIGTGHHYKVDNLLIFIQTIFYFIYTKNFVGRLLSQFYYGFSWAHARFLPNLFSNIIPIGYHEYAPTSFKMINLDGNYFRNAGFSLCWMLIFIGAWIIITAAVYAIYKVRKAKQVWYPLIAKESLFAGVEFFVMNLMFFSYTQLYYSGGYQEKYQSYYDSSQALAITSIVFFGIYSILRFIANRVAGLYMFKRILIPAIIFSSYNNSLYLIPLIILQIVFFIMRFAIERPQKKLEIIFIILEGVALITGYFLMYLCLDAGVNTILISIIIFVFIVYLAFDFTVIYLEYRQEYEFNQLEKQFQREIDQQAARTLRQKGTSNRGSTLFKRQSTLFPTPTVF